MISCWRLSETIIFTAVLLVLSKNHKNCEHKSSSYENRSVADDQIAFTVLIERTI